MASMKKAPLSGAPCLPPLCRGMSSGGVYPQICGVILLPISSRLRLKVRRGLIGVW